MSSCSTTLFAGSYGRKAEIVPEAAGEQALSPGALVKTGVE
jgi:hypothetical protein